MPATYCFKQKTYLWEVKMMACPLFWQRTSTSQRLRLATGSTPVVGSSRNTTGGSPIRAMAVLSFRLLPPLYLPHFRCLYSSKPVAKQYWVKFSNLKYLNLSSVYREALQSAASAQPSYCSLHLSVWGWHSWNYAALQYDPVVCLWWSCFPTTGS